MAYGRNPTSDTGLPPLRCKSNRYLKQQDSALQRWTAIHGKSPALQYTTGGQQDHKGHGLHLARRVWISVTRGASEGEAEYHAPFSKERLVDTV